MKPLKTTSFIMALAMAGTVCCTSAFTEPSSVSAMGIFPSELQYTLDDDTFAIQEGDMITLEDLEDHGLTLTQINELYHDMPEDPDFGTKTKSETELEISECTFDFPDKIVIGENLIHVSYEPSYGVPGSLKLLETDIKINVNFIDYTEKNDGNDINAGQNQPDVSAPSSPAYGEITGDGVVDMSDLTELSLYLLHDTDFDETQLLNADADGNGEIDIADLALMKQYVSGQSVKLGKK